MGCTSSAPAVSELDTNSTDDKNINEENKDDEKKLDTLKTGKELSSSNTGNNAQLNKGNEPAVLGEFYHSEPNLGGDNKESEAEDNNQDDNNLEPSEKLSTLKEVIEHVIFNNTLQEQQSLEDISSKSSHSEIIEQQTENHVEETKEDTEAIEKIDELQVKEIQESVSPSQSEGSRATRWEALADMAAELPPSLTIDPITGHIYALSK